MKASLTREEIKSRQKRKLVEVPVEEWGGVVYVLPLSAGEALDFGTEVQEAIKSGNRQVALAMQLSKFIVDENGQQLFTIEQALAELVNDGPRNPVQMLLQRSLIENGMATEDKIQEK